MKHAFLENFTQIESSFLYQGISLPHNCVAVRYVLS